MAGVNGYLSCDMPAHMFPLCELSSSWEYGCATIRLHQGKTEICGMFLCEEGVQHAEIQHMLCDRDRDNARDLRSVYK